MLDELNRELSSHGLMFGPEARRPTASCTLGGMIGNNSCGASAQAYGKTVDNVHRAGGAHLRRHCGCGSGRTADEEYAEIVAARRTAAPRSTGPCERCATSYARRDPRPATPTSHGASPATTSTPCCPRTASTSPGRSSAREGTLVTVLHAELDLVAGAGRARRWSCSGTPTSPPPPTPCPHVLEHEPDRSSRASTTVLVQLMRRSRRTWTALDAQLPERRRLADGAVRRRQTRTTPTEQAHALLDDARRQPARRRTTTCSTTRRASSELMEVREAGLGATAHAAGEARHLGGLGGLGRAAGPARRLPARPPRAARRVRLRADEPRSTGTSARAACTPASPSTCARAEGIAALPGVRGATPPTWSSPTAGRCPASTATARPAASCCRRCSAPTGRRAFRRVQGAVRPRQPDEPRQGRRPRTRSTRTSGWAPTTRPRSPSTYFALPATTTTASARPPLRCVGVGNCRHQHDGGVMCPSYQVTREEEHSTRGRARLLFEMLERRGSITDGWRSTEVRDALDLCLACKGCKSDCPVERRHGHLQGRVPRPPLQGPAAAGVALRDGLAPAVGPRSRRTRRGW